MNLLASLSRTVVPVLAGYLLTITGALGFNVDSGQAAALATAGFTAAYYLLLRLLEQAADRLDWQPARMAAGLLLGWARSPEYTNEKHVPGTVQVRLDAEAFGADLHEIIRKNIRPGGGQ
jgi:hypothetical protein